MAGNILNSTGRIIFSRSFSMKELNFEQMAQVNGGSDCGTLSFFVEVTCIGALAWPIGTALLAPTCAGTIMGKVAAGCYK